MSRKRQEVRLSDIAAECGVTIVTASKVLNHSGGNNTRVSEKTAARILEVAKRLNYHPNLQASNLRSGSSKLIGVLIDSESIGGLSRMLASIERCADANGFRIMIAEEHDKIDSIIKGYQHFRQYGAAGVICISHDYLDAGNELYRFFEHKPNLVFIGKPKLETAFYVDVEYEEKTRLALEFLWKSGRRRIAMLMDNASYLSLDGRRQGFIRHLEELGGRLDDNGRIFNFRVSVNDPVDIKKRIAGCFKKELLDWNCDALITMSDEFAGNAIREFQSRGIKVPEDVAVIGHGNDRFCELLSPPLASVDDNQVEQGRAAVELIIQICNELRTPVSSLAVTVKPTLCWRESAGGIR